MSVKKIENLNKHENPSTNTNPFDIENYLNANWDTVKDTINNNADELEQAQENIQNNTESIEEINANAEALANRVVELETENEVLKNQIPCGQAEGENITLNDSTEMEFKELKVSGNSWQETREGYNLLDYSKIVNISATSFTYNEDSVTVVYLNIYTGARLDIPIDNKKYLISTDTLSNGRLEISLYKDEQKIGDTKTTKSTYIIDNTSGSYDMVKIMLSNGDYVGTIIFNNFMMIEGTEQKPYEPYGAMPSPEFRSEIKNVTGSANITVNNGLESTDENYQEQVINFPLSEGQRLMLGDYLADDGVHHKRGQVRLSQRTSLSTATVAGVQCQYIAYPITNMKPQGNSASKDFFCDRVKFNNGKFEKYAGYIIAQIFVVLTDLEDTIENVNSVMEGAILEYPLAEEIIESYTEEQQIVYNQIKKATSYKNITHIFSTDEISPVFDVTYRKDLETLFNNVNDAILGGN